MKTTMEKINDLALGEYFPQSEKIEMIQEKINEIINAVNELINQANEK